MAGFFPHSDGLLGIPGLGEFPHGIEKGLDIDVDKRKIRRGSEESRIFSWRVHLVEPSDHAKGGVRVVAELVGNRRYMAIHSISVIGPGASQMVLLETYQSGLPLSMIMKFDLLINCAQTNLHPAY